MIFGGFTMRISNSEIRAKAREALGGGIFQKSWLLGLVILALVSFIFGVLGNMTCGIGTIVLTGPLYLGIHVCFLGVVRKEREMEVGSVFDGLNKNIGSNIMLGFMYTLLVMLWSLLCVIPGILKSYSYALIYYVKADHPEYDWKQCLDESERLMKGNRWQLFCLNLSFIGWSLLGALACGIGSLWVAPYIQASTAVFYNELKQQDEGTYTIE